MRSLLIAGLIAGSTTLSAAVPTVGIQARGATNVSESGKVSRVSFYYTNSQQPIGWSTDTALKGVNIKFRVSGNASSADVEGLDRLLQNGAHTSTASGWKTLTVVKDNKVEGPETLILEILPDPSYRIDPARSKITFTIND